MQGSSEEKKAVAPKSKLAEIMPVECVSYPYAHADRTEGQGELLRKHANQLLGCPCHMKNTINIAKSCLFMLYVPGG